jgi:hypothetical protein
MNLGECQTGMFPTDFIRRPFMCQSIQGNLNDLERCADNSRHARLIGGHEGPLCHRHFGRFPWCSPTVVVCINIDCGIPSHNLRNAKTVLT